MKNRIPLIFILSGFAFLLFYSMFAAKVIPSELKVLPQWVLPLTNAAETETENNTHLLPFKIPNLYGYYTQNGTISFKKEYRVKAVLSEYFSADFTDSASNIPFFDTAGQQIGILKASGFPFFVKKNIYLFLPGGTAVAEYDESGNRKWIYENYIPITAFNSSENGSIIGFADGNITGLFPDGTKRFSFYPGGSTHQVIYGAAISGSGNLSAAISGLNKQRVILCKYANGQNKIIFHSYVTGNVKEQTFMRFSTDESKVFFNDEQGLGIIDCNKLLLSHVPLQGKIVTVEELPLMLVVLTVDGKVYRISFIEDEHLIGSFEFSAENAYIQYFNNALYITRNSVISKLSILRN